MVKKEKATPPRQGVDQSSRHGARRQFQAGIGEQEHEEVKERPARLPEDVHDKFRVK